MTQKSAARLKRDALKKQQEQQAKGSAAQSSKQPPTHWADLNNVYEGASANLHRHSVLAGLAQDKELISFVADKVTLIGLLKSLGSDLHQLSNELTEIHNQHKDKVDGLITDPDDLMYSITIYEQYVLFLERHEGVVMPTVYQITEIFETAERLRTESKSAEAQEAAALDVNVITDVEVKEAPVDVPTVETKE